VAEVYASLVLSKNTVKLRGIKLPLKVDVKSNADFRVESKALNVSKPCKSRKLETLCRYQILSVLSRDSAMVACLTVDQMIRVRIPSRAYLTAFPHGRDTDSLLGGDTLIRVYH
jgi:hypothetical protein